MSTVAGLRMPVLAGFRDWLRTLSTTAGTRVYAHGLPASPTFPAVVLTKVGLVTDGTVTEQTMIQADCWADRGKANDAEILAAEVKNALEQVTPGTQAGLVQILGATIEGEVALHDADDATARYAVTAIITTKVVV
jgi:hypothetical protein